jgi:uncharacterized protein (DUF433 family)
MHLEEYLDFQGPDVIRIKGHRIGLEHIVERYLSGHTPEQIKGEFPQLSLETIYGAITYYLHNKADVDAYIARINEFSDQQYKEWAAKPNPLRDRIQAFKRQLDEEQHQVS